ncbi:ATP-binding protein [Paraflavisolibacter sp. H34]|uniref:ATP-binding protein n=1 Tax=Huijunlia imazamoxiresistens TaxID=3127457 RepID=UPI0030164022
MDNLYDAYLFSEFFDGQPQAVVWTRPLFDRQGGSPVDFEYVYCNDEGARYLNLHRDEVSGLRISNSPTLTDDLRQNILEEMIRVYRDGKPSQSRIFNAAVNKYAKVLRSPFRGGVLSVIQDISEEARMIRELDQQRALAGSILDASPNGVFVAKALMDEKGRTRDFLIERVNPAFTRLLGLSSNRGLLGQSYLHLFPADEHNRVFVMHCRVFETGRPESQEIYYPHLDTWFQISSVKLDSGVLVTFSDISGQKRAAGQIEEQRRLLENILVHSSGGISVGEVQRTAEGVIVDMKMVMANDAAIRLIGLSREEYLSQTAAQMAGEVWTSRMLPLNREALETGTSQHTELFWEPTQKWLEVTLSRLGPDRLIFVLTDITSVKQAQLQLERMVEELQRSNTSLQEFAYAASHDLQEPLRKIQFFSERLRQGLVTGAPEDNSRMLERMENAAGRMRTLIEDLLAFSKASTRPSMTEQVDLNEVVQEVLHDLETSLQQSGARLHIEELPVIPGDERQLRQLFQNLISNALKYRKPEVPPEIALRCRRVREGEPLPVECSLSCYLIEVADNGIGFEQENAEKIFNMFQRLHGRSEYPGTGIGLAIAQKVVTNHNGSIWAEAEPGRGATFFMLLPA